MEQGGNAIDAAIATAFTQGIVDPQMCGIGGWGMMTVYLAKSKELKYLSFLARAGSKVTPTMWENDVEGQTWWGLYLIQDWQNIIGYTSIMTPETVKGLYEAWRSYGTLRWSELLQPAIRYAREGVYVTPLMASMWQGPPKLPGFPDQRTVMTVTPAACQIYLKEDGSFYKVGELLKNEDYANTLEKVAEGGADVFYRGELAEIIANDLKKNGAFVTADDLTRYPVKSGDPIRVNYRGYQIATACPPMGGVTVAEILNILEGYDLKKLRLNSAEYLYVMAKAMQAAHSDMAIWLGDPDFVDVPVSKMISKECAAKWRDKIDAGEEIKISRGESEPKDTTHLATFDEEGNAVSLTHTLGMASGVISPGLGFMYNNAMMAITPFPGHANSAEPGKARTSGMSPTIVLKDGKPFFIVGAPGGYSIISANVQGIVNVIDHGMSAQEAVSAPRIHCEENDVIVSARISFRVCEQLKKKGLKVTHSMVSWGMIPFGLAHGIKIDPTTGRFEGGADPGGGGGIVSSD
jgi:gamma-glutamyltranspeptidase/glutathione hydrolase